MNSRPAPSPQPVPALALGLLCAHTSAHHCSSCPYLVSPRQPTPPFPPLTCHLPQTQVPQTVTYIMHPRAQMSDLAECPFRDTTSGAWKFGVPQSTLGRESWEGQEGQSSLDPRRTTQSLSQSPVAVASGPHTGSQPQVTYLNFHVLVKEEITCR